MKKKNLRFFGMSLVLAAAVVALSWSLAPAGIQSAKADGASAPGTAAPVSAPVTAVSAVHSITVNGKGEMMVDPDVAYVNVGVQTEADSAAKAQSDNAKAFNNLVAVLKKNQIEDKDISTTSFRVSPQYQYDSKQPPKISGYQAVHEVQVTYRDLKNLGNLLDALSGAGANRINGIQFGTEKQQQYQLQALTKAMENAKAKADTLAKSANSEVKGVLSVQENDTGTPPRVFAPYKMDAASSSASSATPIQAGQIKITANVTVKYAF